MEKADKKRRQGMMKGDDGRAHYGQKSAQNEKHHPTYIHLAYISIRYFPRI
jgi:hypothetical protein